MKVLLVDVNCKAGSTGKIVYDIYSYLRKNGHQAAICFGRGELVNEPDIYKFSSDLEVYFHAAMTRLTGLTSCFSFFATRRLIRFIEEYKPDIVHLHDLHGYFINIIPLMNFLKKRKIKTIWTFHCEFMYTGKCGHSYDCEKWKAQCGRCPEKREYPASLFFDFSKHMLKKKKKAFEGFNDLIITAPSQWLVKRVGQSFLRDKKNEVVRNGVDTDVFRPHDITVIKNKFITAASDRVILHVSSNFQDANKGGKYVLELARRLPEVRFIIVGNKAPLNNLPSNVIAVGRTKDQHELALYYALADLFLITSRCENFPTVCLEALCCGTPIIGFTGGGTSETAPDGYGRFVSFGDVDALKKQAELALTGTTRSKAECALFGSVEYDRDNMAERIVKLYLS